MVDHNIKKWLLEDEKKAIWKENILVFLPLTVLQAVCLAVIIKEAATLAGILLSSYREPDYPKIWVTLGICLLVISLAAAIKLFIKRSRYGYVRMAEKRKSEDAYIDGGELILSGRTKGKRSVMRFSLTSIYGLESEKGRTSFYYRNPQGGQTKFTCLDYYKPQIATMLHEKGVR